MTIGIDGEKKDLVFGNEKPSIHTLEGDYLITSEQMMIRSAASFEILHVYTWKTQLGKLLLLKTKRQGLIELSGPENNSQLKTIIDEIYDHSQISTIIVDGAVNRITQLAVEKKSSYYYLMKISPENLDSSLDKIRCFSLIQDIPLWNSKECSQRIVEQKGAFTERNMKLLDEECEYLVLEDFTKIFLGYSDLKQLTEKVSLYFRKTFELESLVLNLVNIEREDFEKELEKFSVQVPLLYNPYRKEVAVEG